MDHSEQLGQGRIAHLIFKFSIPAVIGMVVHSVYNIVDRIYIGWSVGGLGIAGITVVFPIMLLLMAFGTLVGLGANALISIRLGEQRKDEAELVMGNGMVLLILISLIISASGLIFMDPLLRFFGASSSILPYARDYMGIILLGSVAQSISFGMNNFIRAEGNPRTAMFTMLIGAFLNIILDPIFIFALGMGVRGAAIATVISQAVSAVWVLSYFLRGKSTLKIRVKNFRLHKAIVGRILIIGSPPFAKHIGNSGLMVLLNNSLLLYGGDLAISAMGIIHSISTLIIMPIFGISQGIQPIVGYNYGAKRYDRVLETLKLAVLAATAVGSAGFIVIMLFPGWLIGLFSGNDPELIKIGVNGLRTFMALLPVVGFQVVCSNFFQAIGKPKQAMFLSMSRQFILLIPAILILPRYMGLPGVWTAVPVADVGSSLLTLYGVLNEMRIQKNILLANSGLTGK